jgi:hypothetical protein
LGKSAEKIQHLAESIKQDDAMGVIKSGLVR